MKKLLLLLALFALLIGFVSPIPSAADDFFTVTKVQNDQITFKDSRGQLKTMPAGSPDLKVGDKVKIVGDTVCSWDWGNRPAQSVKPPTTQRSLPFDDGSKKR